jgi:L-serine---[L-seryl-carrier protein] ligase
MSECGRDSFPLTTAQRGLWFSQKITPGANMNIAEAVEIRGVIERDTFQRALRQLVAEAEQLRVQVIEVDALPRQIVCATYTAEFPYLDMTREPDPRAAIEAWMVEELARPVDLARDPLWVSALLKAGEDHYFWYHRAHHIVCDGYGGGMVARRLADLYTAFAEGRVPAANQFCTVAEAVAAEKRYRDSRHFQRDRDYWHQRLAQMPEAVTLSRNPRRNGLSSKLLRSTGHLPADTARELATLAKSFGVSVPQVLIGLLAAYYQRATGASDLVFGMPVSGRLSVALRSSVGVCANMVPIRVLFTPEMTAAELFAQVSRLVMQSLRHQQYRYEDLRRDLGLVGQDQNIAWLGINIEPFDYRLSFAGAATILHNLSNSSTEDLMVFVYDRGTDAGLRFDLDANPLLYTKAELDEHRRRLTYLIEQVLRKPGTPLQQLDIIGDEERRRLLFEWNNTAAPVPDATLPGLVARWAAETPEAPAVVFGETVVSYSQLHERSVRHAGQLVARGVKQGDIVAVMLPRSEQLVVALLAIARTGAAYLPLDLDSPPERMALVLDEAKPVVILAEGQMPAGLGHGRFTLLAPADLDAPLNTITEELDLSRPEDRAYVLYTSGSTGRPKGVEITHRNLGNFLRGMQLQLKPSAQDRFLAVTTVTFDIAGLELFLPLTAGACVVIASGEAVHNPPSLIDLIRRSAVTHIQATPSVWRILLASSETKLDGVHALVGGEALSAELAARLKGMAARVTHFYGPTETTIWSTVFELGATGGAAPPIGRPILNTQVYVLDENRQLVPTGTTGELYIGGVGVAKGYLNQPQLTKERFVPDPFADDGSRMFRTGDLARWSDEGLLEFMGRTDDQVKINGHRIEPGEIESVLSQYATIAMAAVRAHGESDGTASLAGYLVPRTGAHADIEAVRTFLATRLPSYMIPSSFTVLDAMPLTPNGKLDRKALPIPQRVRGNADAEPVSPTERRVAKLWQQVLRVERVGLNDNFFELGGDSLSAAEMAAIFPTWFGMELALGSLFETPTVGGLARRVDRLTSEHADPLDVLLPLRHVRKTGQRPLFCIHPVIGFSMGFSSLLRHLDPTMPVYGLQSRGLRGEVSLPNSIEEIASDYWEQIRRIQPEGPYRLVGRSMGGLIAHCIAEQMQAGGHRVELLGMIDSLLFTSADAKRLPTEAEEVRAALNFLNVDLPHESMPRTLMQLNGFLLNADNVRSIPAAQAAAKLVKVIGKENPAFLEQLSAVMLNNVRLARQFMPRKVGVDVLYFHATEMRGNLEGIVDRRPSAWWPFVGGEFEVHELACHHEAVLDPIPAAHIGRILQQRLSASGSAWASEVEQKAANAYA